MRRRDLLELFGGALTWSLVDAKALAMPVVGFFHPGSPERNTHLVAAFHQGLHQIGYEEGQNVLVEYFWASDQYDQLPGLADKLVRRGVTVIVVTGTGAVLAASGATSTIPIVFNFASDPVKLGLVANLSRPGKNLTGVSSVSIELAPKQLELLHRFVPGGSTFALLVNSANSNVANTISTDLQEAARTLGLRLSVLSASTGRELDQVIASLSGLRASGLVISPDTFLEGRIKEIAALSAQHGIPAIYQFREFPAAGGLMSYGTVHTDPYREAGIYAGKILKGIKPGELPVQQPNTLQLVLNLKTAKRLDLSVPSPLLARADEVIE
jgi:putative tryptophan/tyrosine transport system substrate-binding protein